MGMQMAMWGHMRQSGGGSGGVRDGVGARVGRWQYLDAVLMHMVQV